MKVSRVEYRIAWGDGTERDAAFSAAAKDEKDGLLMLRVETAAEAEELLVVIEKFRARKAGEVPPKKTKPPAAAPAAQPPPPTPERANQPTVVNPSKLSPDAPVGGIKVAAEVIKPSEVQQGGPIVEAPKQQTLPVTGSTIVEGGSTASLVPTLKVVGSAPAADPAAVGALVAKVKAAIPAASLAEAQMKAVLLAVLDAGVPKTDVALLTAVCDALRADVPRLSKIARMEERVARTLILLDAEADPAAKGA